MNQERRNKRNTQYKINLEKRHGITKNNDWLEWGSSGIEKFEEHNPMDGHYEFTLTRNKKGDVVSKNTFVYKWTAQAKAIQKLYHDTKNGIKPKEKKPIELFFNVERTKEEIKEYFTKKNAARKINADNREFSPFHYELIEGLYMNNKQIQIIKNTEAAAQHEQKIKDLMHKLMISKANKPSFKLFKKTKKNNETNLSSLNIAA
jgi:hypothetical protein